MLGFGVFGAAVDEHLDLVELVHPEDAASVLAIGAGLPAEAGRPTGVAQRPGRQVDDLLGVVAGQRHLGGAHQVQVVVAEPVHLGGVRAEEPGALHNLGADEHRRDHQGEPGGDRSGRRQLQQPE